MKKLLLACVATIGFCVSGQVADAHPYCRHVYVIEDGCPVRRVVYFDNDDRCYSYYGPRRVYITQYYTEPPVRFCPPPRPRFREEYVPRYEERPRYRNYDDYGK